MYLGKREEKTYGRLILVNLVGKSISLYTPETELCKEWTKIQDCVTKYIEAECTLSRREIKTTEWTVRLTKIPRASDVRDSAVIACVSAWCSAKKCPIGTIKADPQSCRLYRLHIAHALMVGAIE